MMTTADTTFSFIKIIFMQKQLIISMSKRQIALQYIGSFLGFIWTVINPIVMISVFWFVFSVGFKVQPTNNVPFVVWLTAGMASWFLFADIINGSSNTIVSNTHLIKRTLFTSQILPVVNMVACLFLHLILIIILLSLIVFQKMPIRVHFLQVFYYIFCISIFSLGISFFNAALNVFIRDVSQITGVIMQIGFWATPIFWDINMMPVKLKMLLKLNPMFYVVQGYRESFIYFVPFWNHPLQTTYFWLVSILIFFAGVIIFKKLQPHFADVL